MSKVITNELFAERINAKLGNEYKLIGNYTGKYEKVKIQHSCGYEYEIQAQAINNGKGKCPVCFSKNKMYTILEVQLKINRMVENDNYQVTEYNGKRNPIKLFHKDCDSKIELYLANIARDQRCPLCESRYNTKSYGKFKNEIEIFGNNDYELLSDKYINGKEKVLIKHKSCGNIYSVRPKDFLKGRRCPKCRVSYNEKRIEEFLKNNMIEFKSQWKINIEGLIRPLRADFYIKSYNIIIEYDGEGHYLPIFGEVELDIQKKRDELKNSFCKENNIHILRIPYWEKNRIEEILIEQFLDRSTTIENTSKDGSE